MKMRKLRCGIRTLVETLYWARALTLLMVQFQLFPGDAEAGFADDSAVALL